MSGVRRVFAGVHGSLGSLQALRYAASEARQRHAPLVPVIAWVPPGGDLAERRQPNMQLRKLWRDAAREKLFDAFEMGLGGLPQDLDVQPLVVRGPVVPSWWIARTTRTTCSWWERDGAGFGGCCDAPRAGTAWPTRTAP